MNGQSLTNLIVSKPVEVFTEEAKELSLDELKSLTNHLKVEFERVSKMKDAMLLLPQDKLAEHENVLANLYLCLQLIEDRVSILLEIEDSRTIKSEQV